MQGQAFETFSRRIDQKKLISPVPMNAAGAKQDFSVGGVPPDDLVPAGVIGEALHRPTFRGHDINIRIPVVLPGEGDPFSVGGNLRISLIPFVESEPNRPASLGGNRENVPPGRRPPGFHGCPGSASRAPGQRGRGRRERPDRKGAPAGRTPGNGDGRDGSWGHLGGDIQGREVYS